MKKALDDSANDTASLKNKADRIDLEIYDPDTKNWYTAEKTSSGYEMTTFGKYRLEEDKNQMGGSGGGGGGGGGGGNGGSM